MSCRRLLREVSRLTAGVNTIITRLDRIEATVNREEGTMATVSETLAAIQTQLDDVGTDLARELQDLLNAIAAASNRELTDDEQRQADALVAKLGDLKSQIDVADPPPPPTT